MSTTPETTLPELPEDQFPEWANTLRSQVTSSGMTISPELLPPLTNREHTHVFPSTILKSLFRCLHVVGRPRQDGTRRTKTQTVFSSRRKKLLDAIRQMVESTDPRSAKAFSEALFELWVQQDFESKLRWCAWGVGFFGDDEMTLRLYEQIDGWLKQGKWGREMAANMLETLRALETPMAIMTLETFARHEITPSLQKIANETLDAAAKTRGITRSELSDAMVPTCGLDADGQRVFSYGARTFRVTVGDGFTPAVLDVNGDRFRELPDAEDTDDPNLVEDARAAWSLMSRGLLHVFRVQARRLEEAMIDEHLWSKDDWEAHIMRHPLMTLFTQRILWGLFDEESRELLVTFRVSEDFTLADQDDEAIEELPDGAIGIVHTMHLDTARLHAWSSVFVDYEIIAPFAQLERTTYAPTNDERALESFSITRFAREIIDPRTFRTYTKYHGFKRGAPEYYRGPRNHYFRDYERHGVRAVLYIEPGLQPGSYEDDEPLSVVELWFTRLTPSSKHSDSVAYATHLTAEDVPALVVSEAIRDVERMR